MKNDPRPYRPPWLDADGGGMTKRASFTAAEMARAIRAADQAGKVAVLTTGGIVFAEPDKVSLPVQPPHDPFDLVDMSR